MTKRFSTVILPTALVLIASLPESKWPTNLAAEPSPSTATDRRLPYVFDAKSFDAALHAGPDEETRRSIFAERWKAVQRAVAHCSVGGGLTNFHISMQHWIGGGRWPNDIETIQGDLTKPIMRNAKAREKLDANNEGKEESGAGRASTPGTPAPPDKPVPTDKQPGGVRRGGFPPAFGRGGMQYPEPTLVIVEGDCLENVDLEWGSIHVFGDVAARITVKGQGEVIIGGGIKPKGNVVTDGIVKVFVGGSVEGSIHNTGSCNLWVNGDHRGELTTGVPSTTLHVMGHCTGVIKPSAEGGHGMLSLEVGGFVSAKAIEEIAAFPYVQFRASAGWSDQDPGIYPAMASMPFIPGNERRGMRPANASWVVHRRAESEKGL